MGSGCRSVVFLLLAAFVAIAEGQKKLFCYYSSDAQYRKGPGKFMPDNVDPNICTHIIFAFIQPTPDGTGVQAEQWNALGSNGLYSQLVALKRKNPSLRVLLAIGGWVVGSDPFMPVIRSANSIAVFSRAVVAFLRKHHMDGMDMDWEFPGIRGSTIEDRPKFTLLLKTLQDEFTQESARTGNEKLILTMATAAGEYYIGQGYQADQIVKYPDYLLLMTYNYHGAWENVTGHHSAILSNVRDEGPRKQLNMKWTLDFWLSKGAPRHKVVLGLATYGMTFTLKDPTQNGILAPAYGGGRKARYTGETGIMAYYEVCENLAQYNWNKVWIQDQEVPYAYGNDQWVGYDNSESLRIKVQKLINGYGLAGAFVWSVEMDDFRGMCGEGPYPLLRAIKNTMSGGAYLPVNPPPPLTTPYPYHTNPSLPNPLTPTAQALLYPAYTRTPRPNFQTVTQLQDNFFPSTSCAYLGRGIFKDRSHCGQFFYCVQTVDGGYMQYTMRCPPSASFDGDFIVCVYDPTCVD